jgi:hypothetical protein
MIHNRKLPCRTMLSGLIGLMFSGAAFAAADLSNLVSILDNMDGGSWSKVSLNSFSSAWPDAADREMSNQQSIIPAWSGFTWDSNRGDLLLFGGGHANYSGNEVYRWDGTTQMWERASLPSKTVLTPGGNYNAIDGAMNAPSSAHTYDNTNYLAVADRMLVLGGAAYNSGGSFTIPTSDTTFRVTGPYMWDPSKADANLVGGTTGSGVDPATLGGNMWQNRDIADMRKSFVDGTSAATVENGKDVVYFTAAPLSGTNSSLFRLTVNDVNDPSKDTVEQVGAWFGGTYAWGAAGYDPVSKRYVGLSGPIPSWEPAPIYFEAWDVKNAGPTNINQAVIPQIVGDGTFELNSAVGAALYGLDWDPVRERFVIWTGDGTVWALKAPTDGSVDGDWTLTRWTDGNAFADGAVPPDAIQNGVLGKWKYIAQLDAFMALEGATAGNVWLYKPEGWVNPVPVPEPSTYAMLLGGLGLLAAVARRRRQGM